MPVNSLFGIINLCPNILNKIRLLDTPEANFGEFQICANFICGFDGCRDTKKSIRTAHFRYQYRKTAVLSCHRCLINTDVEKINI
jgi:hypothetical protein